MASPVVPRQRASDDVDEIVANYLSEAGGDVAQQFIDTLEESIGELGRHPLVGSLRYSYELDLPELGSWPIRRFPFDRTTLLRSEREACNRVCCIMTLMSET